jgi:hypothetical protein
MDLHSEEAGDPHPYLAGRVSQNMNGKRLQIKMIFFIIERL